MRSLARMEQFSFQIKSRTYQQTWNILRALKLCALYPQSCVEFLTILTAIKASSFRHTGQIQSLHYQNLAPWPRTASDIDQILFSTFSFHFLRTEILELTATEHLWTYLHWNIRKKILLYESPSATVIQPKAGVLKLLLCHGPFLRVWCNLLTPLLTKIYFNTLNKLHRHRIYI
jgi:hypothetical protein